NPHSTALLAGQASFRKTDEWSCRPRSTPPRQSAPSHQHASTIQRCNASTLSICPSQPFPSGSNFVHPALPPRTASLPSALHPAPERNSPKAFSFADLPSYDHRNCYPSRVSETPPEVTQTESRNPESAHGKGRSLWLLWVLLPMIYILSVGPAVKLIP